MPFKDSITLLRQDAGCFAKVYYPQYEDGSGYLEVKNSWKDTYQDQIQIPLNCAENLFEVLQAYSNQPKFHVIRGVLEPNPDGTFRRIAAHTEDVPRYWILLDIDHDNQNYPQWRKHPQETAREIIQDNLPAEFAGVRCFFKWSGSKGVKAGIRAHIWFWLANAYTCKELLFWAKNAGPGGQPLPVDLSLFRPTQPYFQADPIFQGIPDPIPEGRFFIIKGTPEVHLRMPSIRKPDPRPIKKRLDLGGGDSVIEAFNSMFSPSEILDKTSYLKQGSNRYLHPDSTSGEAGLVIYGHVAYAFSPNDPLSGGRPQDSFNILKICLCGGNASLAAKEARRMLNR